MTPARAILVFAILVVGVVGFNVYQALGSPRSDAQLIDEALERSLRDSKDGKPGSALDLLSKTFSVNQTELGYDRASIADFIRKAKPQIEVPERHTRVFGDEARVTSPVNLRMEPLGERAIPEVTMIFQREDDRVYGIFPARRWKLVDVRIPDQALAEFSGF
ncbi:MAG: hypothetical protein SFX74_05785 [Fimbriimonadaceae bacterium]|nr:hypothetical protein [Fimbriimonadaceae bacterium]